MTKKKKKDENRWSQLSLEEKAEIISIYTRNGYTNRKQIVDDFNRGYSNFKNSDANFVQRLRNNDTRSIPDEDGVPMTHRIGYVTEDDGAVIFPEVQDIDGELQLRDYNSAVNQRDTVHTSIPFAEYYSANYKKDYPEFFNRFDIGGPKEANPYAVQEDPYDWSEDTTENGQYYRQLLNFAVNNPGALWRDDDNSAKARAWLRQNAPGTFESLYWNESDDIRNGIDRRFLPDGVESKVFNQRITDATGKAAPYVGAALAAPVVFGEALGAGIAGVNYAPQLGKMALTMLRDMPAFELADRIPTVFGGKRITEYGGDATQWIADNTLNKNYGNETISRWSRIPGEFIAGIAPGVMADKFMNWAGKTALKQIGRLKTTRKPQLGDSKGGSTSATLRSTPKTVTMPESTTSEFEKLVTRYNTADPIKRADMLADSGVSDILQRAIIEGRYTSSAFDVFDDAAGKNFITSKILDLFNAGQIDKSNPYLQRIASEMRAQYDKQSLKDLFNDVVSIRGWTSNDFSENVLRDLKTVLRTRDYKELLRVINDFDNQPENIREMILTAYGRPSVYTSPTGNPVFLLEDEIRRDVLRSRLKDVGIDNFDIGVIFDPDHPDFIKTTEMLRNAGIYDLPADIHHLSWFQVAEAQDELNELMSKYNMTLEELKAAHPLEYQAVCRKMQQAMGEAAVQSRLLQVAMPRGTAIAEHNTSVDSYRTMLKGAVNSPGGYGYGPNQTSILVHRHPDGSPIYYRGNNLQQNRLMFNPDGSIYSTKNLQGLDGLFTRSDIQELYDRINTSGNSSSYFADHPEDVELGEKILAAMRILDESNVKSTSAAIDSINKRYKESIPAPLETIPTDIGSGSMVRSFISGLLSNNGAAAYMTRPKISTVKHKSGGFLNNFYTGGEKQNFLQNVYQAYTHPETLGEWAAPAILGKTVLQLFDPLGITSWPDVYRAFNEDAPTSEKVMEIVGALPMLGKIAKPIKLAKGVTIAEKSE